MEELAGNWKAEKSRSQSFTPSFVLDLGDVYGNGRTSSGTGLPLSFSFCDLGVYWASLVPEGSMIPYSCFYSCSPRGDGSFLLLLT